MSPISVVTLNGVNINYPPMLKKNGLVAQHFAFAGRVSYSLYLLHQPLLLALGYAIYQRHLHPLISFGSCIALWPAILLLAYGFYQIVEVPSIGWGKRWSRPAKKGAPLEAPLLDKEIVR